MSGYALVYDDGSRIPCHRIEEEGEAYMRRRVTVRVGVVTIQKVIMAFCGCWDIADETES